jgi:hypothetical protein
MTRERAAQIRAVLADCYPAADVSAAPESGGVRFELTSDGPSRLTLSVGDDPSPLLSMLIYGSPRPPG